MDKIVRSDEILRRRAQDAARLRSSKDIRQFRQKLVNGNQIKPEFEHELMTMFARNEMGAAFTMPALSIIFSLASLFWAPAWEAMLWLLMVIVAKVLLLEQARRFLSSPNSKNEMKMWRRRFILAESLNGVTWAGFALVGMMDEPANVEQYMFSSQVFIFATLIIILAIRMMFASTVISILHAGTIPVTIAVVCRLVIFGDPFPLALAAMAIGVHIYFFVLARGINATALAMCEYRAQKDDLIAELEEQKSKSDSARTRAEAANDAKSRFLATMSHELRTPLNAIMGFSEVMKSEVLGKMHNSTYRDYAENIHESGTHLLKLINEILDLSRIEADSYELHEEPLHLADIAEDCRRLLKLRATSKGLDIVDDIDQGLPQIWADERACRQMCLNLLSNALKFTPRGGRILITVAGTADGGQILSVRDTGPGIPKDEIPKVLQSFGQGSLAHETAEGGTGLGLSIVKSLVELHGGTFELRSELRKGTQAIDAFPKRRILVTLPPLQPLGDERHRQSA